MNPEKQKSNEQPDISLIDTNEIVQLLKKYNTQFGMGQTTGKIFLRAMDDTEHVEKLDTKTTGSDEQAAEQLLSYDEMKSQTGLLLNTLGLEYQPMKSNWALAGSGENHVGSEMRLNLKDGKHFISYLQALQPESITESQKDGLKEIISVLAKQFNSYSLDDLNDDRLLEFMGSISPIIDEYKRLFGNSLETIPEGITKLETYLSYARKGCLREFRKVEELHLDKPPTGKGFVLRWHNDASPKFLQERWGTVIDVLKIVSDNERARELYETAKTNALKAVNLAIEEVLAKPDSSRDKKNFLSILNTTKARLADF